MTLNKLLFYLCVFIFCFEYSIAQNNQLRAYTVEDGLPQSQVYDLVQDKIGYLWLGTQGGGLSRFDGETFVTWKEQEGLGSNYIQALATRKDTVFIGTRRGLSIKIRQQFLNIAAPSVTDFLFLGNKQYLATQEGLYTYDDEEGLQKLNLHPAIDQEQINDLYFDGDWYWIATADALWKLRSLTQQPQTIQPYETSNFISVTQYKDKIYAATFDAGILVIDPSVAHTADKIITQPIRVNDIIVLNEQELWVATDNIGITVFDAENRQVIKRVDQDQGLSVSHVRKSFSDQQGNVWIATSGGGLFKYFQNNFKHYDRDTGLKGNRVYAVHAMGDDIWLSNAEKGLTKIDTAGIHHIPQATGFSSVKIKTLASDPKGNLWAGSDGKGIRYRYTTTIDSFAVSGNTVADLKIDTLKKEVIKNRLITTEDGLPADWIRKIIMIDSTAWVASYSDGIVKLQYNIDKEEVRILKQFGAKNGIQDLLITDMIADEDNRVWYATQKGHLGYIEQKKVTHLGQVLPVDVKINSILFHKGHLYVGTAGNGIWWTDREAQAGFKKLDGQKHPYSNTIYQLIFDDQETLWAGTESGVDKILLNQEQEIIDVFHFGRNEGFLGIETCLNAVTKDTKGNLWFGAIYGLTSYENFETTEEVTKPNLYFEGVEIAYKNIDTLQFERWNNAATPLQLKPTQQQLSLNYKTVDIDHPQAVQYRYKLNDEVWSPWTREGKQNFSGLAYGVHHFMAQSRNYRWVESDPISLHFFIEIPLYQKPWFQWAGVGVLALLMSFLSWRYIQGVKRRNAKQRKQLELENHLLSLEQKALRLQMNPHFIFNALNGIKAMGSQDPEKMETTVNTFATLLRETLYNSREDTITLAQEIKTITHYIEVEQLMARSTFSYGVHPPETLDPEEILIPPMLIQPFVENAIRHGILKNQKEGILTITFVVNDTFLECSVRDNGIGIFQSQKDKAPTDHQSMALTVTRERIESLSGKDALQIREIKEEGIIAGTEISFKIPLQTDY